MAQIETRDQHEEQYRKILQKVTERHRKELVLLLGKPPNPYQVPAEFWQKVQSEAEQELKNLMLILFEESAISHGLHPVEAKIQAVSYADRRAAALAENYRINSQQRMFGLYENQGAALIVLLAQYERGETTLGKLRSAVKDFRKSGREIAGKVFNEQRASGLAITETTAAQSSGAEKASVTSGTKDEEDTWFTREDDRVCPICAPLHGAPRSVWQQTFPLGPPAHPNCRCWIHYSGEKGGIRSAR